MNTQNSRIKCALHNRHANIGMSRNKFQQNVTFLSETLSIIINILNVYSVGHKFSSLDFHNSITFFSALKIKAFFSEQAIQILKDNLLKSPLGKLN